MNLYDYFLSNKLNPIHKNLHSFPVYERYFSNFVNKPVTFLEIGAGRGRIGSDVEAIFRAIG